MRIDTTLLCARRSLSLLFSMDLRTFVSSRGGTPAPALGRSGNSGIRYPALCFSKTYRFLAQVLPFTSGGVRPKAILTRGPSREKMPTRT